MKEKFKECVDILPCHGAGIDCGTVVSIRKADIDRLVEEYDICMVVPTVWVMGCVSAFFRDATGSELEK